MERDAILVKIEYERKYMAQQQAAYDAAEERYKRLRLKEDDDVMERSCKPIQGSKEAIIRLEAKL